MGIRRGRFSVRRMGNMSGGGGSGRSGRTGRGKSVGVEVEGLDKFTKRMLKLDRNYVTMEFGVILFSIGIKLIKKIQYNIMTRHFDFPPLAPRTIAGKGGRDLIFVDTAGLIGSLGVVEEIVDNREGKVSMKIGARDWARSKRTGAHYGEILNWLEYGTDRIPPRPIVTRTFEEEKPKFMPGLREGLHKLIELSKAANARPQRKRRAYRESE